MASDQTKVVEDVQLTDEQKAKRFVTEYEELCEKYQVRIVTTPVFVSTNHGSFEVTLQSSVGKLPKQQ